MTDDPLRGRTVAVTGATGFLGRRITAVLLDRGASPVAVVRSPEKAADLAERGVRIHRADLAEIDAMAEGFHGCDAVVANAARVTRIGGSRAEYEEANTGGTENTLRAAHLAGVGRVVYVSSAGVYRTRIGRPMAEDTPFKGEGFDWSALVAGGAYAASKASAERRAWALAEELALELTTLRPGPIYGPGESRMAQFYRRALTKRVVPAPTTRIPHTHVDDVAEAVVQTLAVPGSAGRAYNLGGRPESIRRALGLLKSAAGAGPVLVPIPLPLTVEFDDARAVEELGYRRRPIDEGLDGILPRAREP